MSFNSASRLFVFALLLFVSTLNTRCVVAANPNFAKTTILSSKESAILFHLSFNADVVFGKQSQRQSLKTAYWTPTAAEIAQAQESLWTYTRTSAFDPSWNHFGYKPSTIALTNDFQQYAGVMQGGRKRILLNGFTAAHVPLFAAKSRDWQTNSFSDGGSAFRAVYDPVTRRIEYLVFDNFVERELNRSFG